MIEWLGQEDVVVMTTQPLTVEPIRPLPPGVILAPQQQTTTKEAQPFAGARLGCSGWCWVARRV